MQFKTFCVTVSRFEGCPEPRVREIFLTSIEYLLKILAAGDSLPLPGIGKISSEVVELKRGGTKIILVFEPGPGYSGFL